MPQPHPVRPWRKILLSFAGGFVLMHGVLAAVTPAEVPPALPVEVTPAEQSSARAKVFAREVARVYGTLDSVLLRRLNGPLLSMPPEVAAAMETEVLSLSDRVLTAPERIRRLLDKEGEVVAVQYGEAPEAVRAAMLAAHARRADRVMADLQPIFDRRLDYLLCVADALHLARGDIGADTAAAAALLAEVREKHAGLAADAPVLADLDRRFGLYFDPAL